MWFSVTVLHCVICLSCYNDYYLLLSWEQTYLLCHTEPCYVQVLLCLCVYRWMCVCFTQCVAQWKENHTLMNVKSTRGAWPLKYYIMRHTVKKECHVLKIHASILRGKKQTCDIFSIYILLQAAANKICFQKHSSLICQKHKVCLQQRRAPQSTN